MALEGNFKGVPMKLTIRVWYDMMGLGFRGSLNEGI